MSGQAEKRYKQNEIDSLELVNFLSGKSKPKAGPQEQISEPAKAKPKEVKTPKQAQAEDVEVVAIVTRGEFEAAKGNLSLLTKSAPKNLFSIDDPIQENTSQVKESGKKESELQNAPVASPSEVSQVNCDRKAEAPESRKSPQVSEEPGKERKAISDENALSTESPQVETDTPKERSSMPGNVISLLPRIENYRKNQEKVKKVFASAQQETNRGINGSRKEQRRTFTHGFKASDKPVIDLSELGAGPEQGKAPQVKSSENIGNSLPESNPATETTASPLSESKTQERSNDTENSKSTCCAPQLDLVVDLSSGFGFFNNEENAEEHSGESLEPETKAEVTAQVEEISPSAISKNAEPADIIIEKKQIPSEEGEKAHSLKEDFIESTLQAHNAKPEEPLKYEEITLSELAAMDDSSVKVTAPAAESAPEVPVIETAPADLYDYRPKAAESVPIKEEPVISPERERWRKYIDSAIEEADEGDYEFSLSSINSLPDEILYAPIPEISYGKEEDEEEERGASSIRYPLLIIVFLIILAAIWIASQSAIKPVDVSTEGTIKGLFSGLNKLFNKLILTLR